MSGYYKGGIDIGGTKTICAVADENNNIIDEETYNTDGRDVDAFFSDCAQRLLKLAQVNKIPKPEKIGLSLPGMVSDDNILIHAPFLKWRNVDVPRIMRKLTGVEKIFCDCDVNACALAESRSSKCDNFLWMTVSTGIGGAFVINGKVYRGKNCVAGEIGHMKVEYENPNMCTCGKKGCVEAHASGTALTKLVLDKCRKDKAFEELFENNNLPEDAAGCAALAKKGVSSAQELFDIVGDYIGRAAANAINLTDPGTVFIGGGMSKSFDLLYPSIERRIKSDVIEYIADTQVKPTAVGYNAALMGALYLCDG